VSRKQRVQPVTKLVTKLRAPAIVPPVTVTFLPVDGPKWFLVDARGSLVRADVGLARYPSRRKAEEAAEAYLEAP
jgi:hypothetical protein